MNSVSVFPPLCEATSFNDIVLLYLDARRVSVFPQLSEATSFNDIVVLYLDA